MKRKLMLGLLSAVGGLTIIGSGFSAWYFEGSAEAKHSNIGVTVTDVVSQYGTIKATEVVGLTLCLDQGGFAQKDNHEAGITFATPITDTSTLSTYKTFDGDFGATYTIEAGNSLNAKNAGLKATFKVVVTLKEVAAKYLTFKDTFTDAAGYKVPTYEAGHDVTFTLEQTFDFSGSEQTLKFNFDLKTNTDLSNNAFKYTDGKKPQDETAYREMKAALLATHTSILTFDYSLEITHK